ncbi:hypothetical protein [Streptomyces adustus]|uniref:hypothetical protein n=1 Tax=Streptomyces adustus TaxID=1609272 RepID=UPI00192E5CBD|nr:hypothetical protein [Streptomyces adustus]
MRTLTLGAVLGLLWLLFGWPFASPFGGLATLVQPVTLAFAAGVLARPYLIRQGWLR